MYVLWPLLSKYRQLKLELVCRLQVEVWSSGKVSVTCACQSTVQFNVVSISTCQPPRPALLPGCVISLFLLPHSPVRSTCTFLTGYQKLNIRFTDIINVILKCVCFRFLWWKQFELLQVPTDL